jgi:hypothetical protein
MFFVIFVVLLLLLFFFEFLNGFLQWFFSRQDGILMRYNPYHEFMLLFFPVLRWFYTKNTCVMVVIQHFDSFFRFEFFILL